MNIKKYIQEILKGLDYEFLTDIEIRITKIFPKNKWFPFSKSIITYKYSDYLKNLKEQRNDREE